MRNTGRTDDAVVIMVIMMQQHTNIYKLHLAARLPASSGPDYVTKWSLVGGGVESKAGRSVMQQYGHDVTSANS